MDPIYPNLSIRSKINVNKKSWDTPHLKDNLILNIFLLKDLGRLGSIFAVMCRQSYWWRCCWKNYIFPVKTIEIFAWIVPTKWNYESTVDTGEKVGGQISISPKNDFPGNIISSSKTCSLKEVLRKYSINFINLSKFLAILYHKPTYNRSHFW